MRGIPAAQHPRAAPRTRRLCDAREVVLRDAPRAEDAAVGKVLGAQVADRKPRQHDGRAAGGALGELVVDDVPLRVHDGLVLARVVEPHLGILLFRLELQLDVEQQDLGVCGGRVGE